MNSAQRLPAGAAVQGRRRAPDPWLIPAALVALIPLLALLRPGIANTADGMVHILRIVQVEALMKAGTFYPQWAPDFYYGYGYPFFLFYAPGVHMAAGLLALLGLGASRALVAVQVVSLLLYGTGSYLAARSLFEGLARPRVVSMAALGAAGLYVLAPLRLRELFIQGNLSQLVALSLLPWALWALVWAARKASLRWAALAGAILAALLYAHHASAFLAYPLLLVLAFAVAVFDSQATGLRRFAPLVVAFGLALALSAPFWLPWLVESSYGSLGRIESGMFNAALNLLPADELFSPSLPLDASSINSPLPNTLGLVQAILAAVGTITCAVMLWRNRKTQPERGRLAVLLTLGGLLALSLVLMLPLAAPAWTSLPIAKFIAFPWRLLGPAGLFAAILGVVPLLLLPERRIAALGLSLVLVLALLNVGPYLFPLAGQWMPEPAGGVQLVDIGRHEVHDGWRATTSANEYLPRWVKDQDPPLTLLGAYEAGGLPQRLETEGLPAGSRVQVVKNAPLEDVYHLSLPEATTIRLQRFYYPGWQAWIDGRPTPIRPSSPYGLIELTAPAGESELRVAWGTTPPRTAGWVLFGAGVLLTAGLLLRRERRQPAPEARAVERAGWLPFVGLLLVVAGLKLWWIEPHTQWFRLQSPVEAPAGMTHPVHARFANGVELLGYDLRDTDVTQEGEVRVRLYWRTLAPLTENLQSYVHLDAPVTQLTWGDFTKDNAGDKPTKSWPVGFYVVDDFRLRVPGFTPPVRANLNVGLLDEHGAPVPLVDGGHAIPIGSVAVHGEARPYAERTAATAAYRLGDSISLEGYDAELVEADPAAGRASPEVRLTLYWRTARPLGTDYTVFAHVLDANGNRVAQKDGPACDGSCPTTAWTPGGLINDMHTIALPAGVPEDGLEVLVGLYELGSGQRLPAADRQGVRQADDAIRIPVRPAPTP